MKIVPEHNNSLLKNLSPIDDFAGNIGNILTNGVINDTIRLNDITLTYSLEREFVISHYILSTGSLNVTLEFLGKDKNVLAEFTRTGNYQENTIEKLNQAVSGVKYIKLNVGKNVTSTTSTINVWGNRKYLNKILLLSETDNVTSIEFNKVDENENQIPTMTSDTLPEGVASASSFLNGNSLYAPWRAFDGNPSGSTRWRGINNRSSDEWLQYEFYIPTMITKYKLYPHTSFSYSPTSWRFEGSNDGVEWIVLDHQDNITNWEVGVAKEFTLKNKKKYKSYRIYVLGNMGGSAIAIAELEMFSHSVSVIKGLSNRQEKNFINHGMSPQELSEIDFSFDFTEKHYIQDQSTPLGSGKVFEQTLDIDKIIKSVKIT